MKWRGWLLAAAIAGCASAANARRTVDYAVDDTVLAQWAAEQKTSLAPQPERGSRNFTLTLAPGTDHEVVRGGIFCSAWTVDNPISRLLETVFARRDADGRLDTPADIAVAITRAATFTRCVQIGELKGACITRVSIDGTAVSPGGAQVPIRVAIERPTELIGACAGLTRGIALVSRAAAMAALAQAEGGAPAS